MVSHTAHNIKGERAKTGWLKSQDNVSEWGDMSILGLLFQVASIIKFQQSGPHHHLIEKIISNI